MKAPVTAFIMFNLLPVLKRMGIKVDYSVKYFGFYPDMIGLVEIISFPVRYKYNSALIINKRNKFD